MKYILSLRIIFTIVIVVFSLISCWHTTIAASLNIEGRIINGQPAKEDQFPWQVVLKLDAYDGLHCGGSIIAPQWVLTAAHCAYGLDSIFLMFGTTELEDPNAVTMTSTQLYVNPNYNRDYMNNDIALIQLPTPLIWSVSIQPISLVSPSQENNNFVGALGTIAGFGLIDDEYLNFSDTLLYAKVQIINNSKCVPIFGKNVVLSSTMCANGANGSNMSICSGDSGGPLIIQDSTGHAIQIGINSFVARDRCSEGYPSGYVRLTSYLDYISTVTGISPSSFSSR